MNNFGYHPGTSLSSANGFFKTASNFFKDIPDNPSDSAKYAVDRLGSFVAAATNLVFSIELYLKCLSLAVNRDQLNTHDLIKLYNELPNQLKDSIQNEYEKQISKSHENEIMALQLLISKEEIPDKDLPEIENPDNSVIKLLRNERNAFQTWRYIHEFRNEKKFIFCNFEYKRLCVLANSILMHIKTNQH